MIQKNQRSRRRDKCSTELSLGRFSVLLFMVLMLPPQLSFPEEFPDLPYNHVLGPCDYRAHSVFAEFTHQAVSVQVDVFPISH